MKPGATWKNTGRTESVCTRTEKTSGEASGGTPFCGFLLAAPKSGEGKTTVAVALMRALENRGLFVQPFKCGPDYIDPGFHAAAAGRPSCNLDTWMMGKKGVRKLWAAMCREADCGIAEGAMGLFDSIRPGDAAGSAADCAKALHLPVILVFNARGMAWSVAALVEGFQRRAEAMGLRLAGVIANNAGSIRHKEILAMAMEKEGLPPLLGALPRNREFALPERQLGLVPQGEACLSEEWLDALAQSAEDNIDIERILSLTQCLRPQAIPAPATERQILRRMGIAKDKAFCFYYRENEAVLRQKGWDLVPFSPLKDKALPEKIDAIYLGGGYPEVFAKELSENTAMRSAIRDFAQNNGEIYAECGGYMYLCSSLEVPQTSLDGKPVCKAWPMCDVISATARMGQRLRSLGYREASFLASPPFGLGIGVMRGHEFHWSDIELHNDYPPLYTASSASSPAKQCGVAFGNVRAGYVHLYFQSLADADGNATDNSDDTSADVPKHQDSHANKTQSCNGQVILLNGPSSAGKTTLGKALQKKLHEKYGIHALLLSVDQLLMAANSTGSTVISCLAETGLPVIETFHATIEVAAKAGAMVIADHVLGENAVWINDLYSRLEGIKVLPVQVACDIEELARREYSRKDRQPDLPHALRQAENIHVHLPCEIVIDTTKAGPDDLADIVLDALSLPNIDIAKKFCLKSGNSCVAEQTDFFTGRNARQMPLYNEDIADMQCWVFRMAQVRWKISAKECTAIFKENDILGFIADCYDSLHLNSYACALDDVETLLHNQGVSI